MIKKLLLSAMAVVFVSGCLGDVENSTEDQSSVDETAYEFVISSDFALELDNSNTPTTWKLLWNESEDSDIEGVLVGKWGVINMIGRVDSERVISFASSSKSYGPNGINLVYFVLPAGELSGDLLITADAFVNDTHFYNAQLTATVNSK